MTPAMGRDELKSNISPPMMSADESASGVERHATSLTQGSAMKSATAGAAQSSVTKRENHAMSPPPIARNERSDGQTVAQASDAPSFQKSHTKAMNSGLIQ